LAAELLEKNDKPISLDKENHLYLYAIIRSDLEMPTGKLASQAGHAFTDVLAIADPEQVAHYRNENKGGSKVTLKAKNQHQLLRAYLEIRALGIPVVAVVDREHVLPPHFDGNPIITAIGIGPCKRSEVRHILKKFQVV